MIRDVSQDIAMTIVLSAQLTGLAETARLLGISRQSLYRCNASGQLEFIKIGRRTMVPADSIARFLAAAPRVRTRVA